MKIIKYLTAYLLMTTLMLTAIVGCGNPKGQEENTNPEEPLTTEEPVATEAPAVPTFDSERKELEIERNFLQYRLSEENIADFETQLLLCEQMLQDEVPYSDMEVEVQILEELERGIRYQAIIAEIMYDCDTRNEKAAENYLFSAEVASEISAEKNLFLAELYTSGKHDRYFDNCTDSVRKYYAFYSGETAELEVRNAELRAEFNDLQEEEFEEKIGKIYSESINNYNEIATESGFANYYEYATHILYKREYGREEREQLRQYVKKYIVPLYYLAYERYEEAYNEATEEDHNFINALLKDAYNSLETDYVKAYLQVLPESCSMGMLRMFEEEAYVLSDNRDAWERAYTVFIGVPFCYFGPNYQQAFTIIHELGHYYAYMNGSWSSFDLNETHSQGNEMLFLTYLGTVLEPEAYESLRTYQLYDSIRLILMATIMDEFEETIYGLPSRADYTAEDFDEIMHNLLESYGLADDENVRDYVEQLWRNVGIRNPVYYLNYATSAVVSLNLYSLSVEDYDAALEAYRIIQEEVDMNRNFIGTLEKAGMDSVFEEEAYIKLQEMFEE